MSVLTRSTVRAFPLTVGPLTEDVITRIHERIRKEDAKECWTFGSSPHAALMDALLDPGPKYAVWGLVDGYPTPVGAFGLNHKGNAIWSLWTDDLTGAMKRCILRETRTWVRTLLLSIPGDDRRGRNYVGCSNLMAIRWLRKSDCFTVSNTAVRLGEAKVPMLFFETKSLYALESLDNV